MVYRNGAATPSEAKSESFDFSVMTCSVDAGPRPASCLMCLPAPPPNSAGDHGLRTRAQQNTQNHPILISGIWYRGARGKPVHPRLHGVWILKLVCLNSGLFRQWLFGFLR